MTLNDIEKIHSDADLQSLPQMATNRTAAWPTRPPRWRPTSWPEQKQS